MIANFLKPAADSAGRVIVKAATSPENLRACTQIATRSAAWVAGVIAIPVTLKVAGAVRESVPKAASCVKGAVAKASALAALAKAKMMP
jgi:hypothetical protein